MANSADATPAADVAVLRDLVQRYLDVCARPDQARRREHWSRLNSLEPVPPPIYIRACAWHEMVQSRCQCQDRVCRAYESQLRHQLFQDTFGDDFIFEPWLTVNAVHTCAGWGVSPKQTRPDQPNGAWKEEYPIREPEDLAKLRTPHHGIDEARTAGRVARLRDLVGDLIPINLDRAPAYRMWTADLSTDLGHLRGIENVMLDMMDRPEWLHRLLASMRDGVLATHEQAERAGDWGLAAHQNQAMPYARELRPPAANVNGVRRRDLWVFLASQEFTLVGPAMWDEFLLQYQVPILAPFGLAAYGCCEDLTRKIPYLRRIPNLRRIALTSFADVPRCAEQVGGDYVLSYRPSPADMVGYGFDPARVRRIVGRDLRVLREHGCRIDITLKDVETVQGDPDRIRNWVRVVRELIVETGWA